MHIKVSYVRTLAVCAVSTNNLIRKTFYENYLATLLSTRSRMARIGSQPPRDSIDLNWGIHWYLAGLVRTRAGKRKDFRYEGIRGRVRLKSMV